MKIGVLMGGVSTEREISLRTGENLYESVDSSRHEKVRIVLNEKKDVFEACKDLDFALLALHGQFGEDGRVQGILEAMGIPYSGSDVKSSALAMDKDLSKKVLAQSGLPVADWVMVHSLEEAQRIAGPFLKEKGKVCVKPNSGGSSVMTFLCETTEELAHAVQEALTVDWEVMVEEFICGDEITVPILGGRVLPTLLIRAQSGFFDYTAKYQDEAHGGAKEEVIDLPEPLKQRVEDLALATYHTLKCSVYGRVDFILREGVPYLLEINTLPGMTATSLIPRSAKAAGMDYAQLVERIIELSLAQRRREGEKTGTPAEIG
ncbi:D-alanine--D-alanine ligase [Clostridiaceae bacterium JG1575]|nr:D-alanine--D-alanine ligase [Clostridiaceae bacterium JG1575]